MQKGQVEVSDADLSKYFDRIPHEKLEIALGERISDKGLIDLIKKWLKAPVREKGQDKGGKKNNLGRPQSLPRNLGEVLSRRCYRTSI